jgi:hydrogenase nickel incorporation protein HypB
MNTIVPIGEKVLSENDRLAASLRAEFARLELCVLNLVSSPGSGKTSLLERTLAGLGDRLRIGVVVGDVETENDARRLERAGGKLVRPIVTRGACHLDARMIDRALAGLRLDELDLLFIENVGNLVCPSSYDLGEAMKVVLISTTEGDDKPLKYPAMFRRSGAMVVNKIDLLGTSDFDPVRVREYALSINGTLEIMTVSCRTGQGLPDWFGWLERQVAARRAPQKV